MATDLAAGTGIVMRIQSSWSNRQPEEHYTMNLLHDSKNWVEVSDRRYSESLKRGVQRRRQ